MTRRIGKAVIFFLAFTTLALAPSVTMASGGGGKESGGEKTEGEGKKSKEEEISGGKFEGDPVYVRLKPVILPIISDDGTQQLVNLIINLETKDLETATKMNGNKPRLNDAIIRALYGGLAEGSMRNGNALDIPKVKSAIRDTINKTFGEGAVKEVLLQAVEQRRF